MTMMTKLWWTLLSLLLAAELRSTFAFSSMPIAPTHRGTSGIASTIENVIEPTQQIEDDLTRVLSAEERQSIQLRTVDKDVLINTSIFIVAIATVLTAVLSVDVGITRGWTAEEIALRIPLDNWRSYTNILSMAPIETKVGDFISFVPTYNLLQACSLKVSHMSLADHSLIQGCHKCYSLYYW